MTARRRRTAARNVGFTAAVSLRALNARTATDASLAQGGISPHLATSNRRIGAVPNSSTSASGAGACTITGTAVVGAMLYDCGNGASLTRSISSSTASSLDAFATTNLPHMRSD